jgi:hypothetical protein
MMSVNQMAAETILMETWRLLNGESANKMRMTSYSSVSSMVTRGRAEGRLEVEAPTASFMYHGARLWNSAPQRVKIAKSKFTAKKVIRESVKRFPLL